MRTNFVRLQNSSKTTTEVISCIFEDSGLGAKAKKHYSTVFLRKSFPWITIRNHKRPSKLHNMPSVFQNSPGHLRISQRICTKHVCDAGEPLPGLTARKKDEEEGNDSHSKGKRQNIRSQQPLGRFSSDKDCSFRFRQALSCLIVLPLRFHFPPVQTDTGAV